jgi:hypothetical protein
MKEEKNKQEKLINQFNNWIQYSYNLKKKDGSKTLILNSIKAPCLNDLLQNKEFTTLLENNNFFFKNFERIIISDNAYGIKPLNIQKGSAKGIEHLCQALKNVNHLSISDFENKVDIEIVEALKIPNLSSLEFSTLSHIQTRTFLRNHQKIKTLNVAVNFPVTVFFYMRHVEELIFQKESLTKNKMKWLAQALWSHTKRLPKFTLPSLKTLDLSRIESSATFIEILLPAIYAVKTIQVKYNETEGTRKALKNMDQLELKGPKYLTESDLLLAQLQDSLFWKDERLYAKYIAPSLDCIFGYQKTNLLFTNHHQKPESISEMATYDTLEILSHYVLMCFNSYLEKNGKLSSSNKEKIDLLLKSRELMNDILPIILSDYIYEKVKNSSIRYIPIESIVSALKIFNGAEFTLKNGYILRKKINCPTTKIETPELSENEIEIIFKGMLVDSKNLFTKAKDLNTPKMDTKEKIIENYVIQFINKYTDTTFLFNKIIPPQLLKDNAFEQKIDNDDYSVNNKKNSSNDPFKNKKDKIDNIISLNNKIDNQINSANSIHSDHDNQKVSEPDCYFGFFDAYPNYSEPDNNNIYSANENNDNQKSSEFDHSFGLFDGNQNYSVPENNNIFSVNEKNDIQNIFGNSDFGIEIIDLPPTLEDLQENLEAHAFEPTTLSLFDYQHSSQDEILDEIHKNIMNLLYSNEHKDRNNFICLLPDNYHISENGEFSGAHYICILRKGDAYEIFDPLTEGCANKPLYALIKNVKTKLGFPCFYGTQDILNANTCAKNCINYIKSQSLEVKK